MVKINVEGRIHGILFMKMEKEGGNGKLEQNIYENNKISENEQF